jgi:hypothetical protein
MLVVLLLQLTTRTAAFSPHNNNLKPSALRAGPDLNTEGSRTIADVADGWLSPQQVKTLRKEIDDRRARKRLAYRRLEDAELGGASEATLAAAEAALGTNEFFEAGGPAKLSAKAFPDVAFALAEECDAMVVQIRKKKAVLYRPLPPGTPGAVVMRTSGKVSPWKARAPAVRDSKGRILGREDDFEDEEDADPLETAWGKSPRR